VHEKTLEKLDRYAEAESTETSTFFRQTLDAGIAVYEKSVLEGKGNPFK
jgi:hypothetical protein